jgi:cobalt-zinc-cadmium efflux system outer membrane protein
MARTHPSIAGATLIALAALLLAHSVWAQGVPLPPIGRAAYRPDEERLPLPKGAEKEWDGEDREDGRGDPAALPMPRRLADPAAVPPASRLGLPDLIALALQHNPRLAQAAYAVDAARGRAVQASLYPNPVVSVVADELFDRQGPGGIITAPQISQEIVRGGKLELSRAAAEREVDQATLSLASLRYQRLASVRQAYFEVITLQRRLEILDDLVGLADRSAEAAEKLRKAGQVARLDIVQLEVERERFRAEKEATQREQPAAFGKLLAAVGVRQLPSPAVTGPLELPGWAYDFDKARLLLVNHHPDIRSAQAGVERARLLLERAKAEPIPNVTVQAGYVRQNQNKSNDAVIGFSVPVPCWNKNQGNIAAAQAELGEAIQQVGRVEFELVERLSEAFRTYAAARQRAYRYQKSILPRARESYQLSLKGYQAGQFDYLRVLEAQRAYGQADLEYVRSLGEMWRAAAELSGLLLEEQWPSEPTAGGVGQTK